MTDETSENKSTTALREKLIRCFAASEELIAAAVENFESQPERTLESRLILSRQLLSIIDQLLEYEDWGDSPFINQLLKPTRAKKEELTKFIEENGDRLPSDVWQKSASPEGSKEVYALLYQASGEDMQGWENQICDLHRNAVSRPLYGTAEEVEKCIRLRGNQSTDGYVLLFLPENYLQEAEAEVKDKYDQNLLQLRKTDLQSSFVQAFFHQGQIYRLQGDKLVKMKAQSANGASGHVR